MKRLLCLTFSASIDLLKEGKDLCVFSVKTHGPRCEKGSPPFKYSVVLRVYTTEMSRLTELADLESITYRLRLTASEADREKVYSELLNFTDSSETCECVIHAYALFGLKGVLDVLQTLEHVPRARHEFASSRSLKPCLDMLQELKHAPALSAALAMLHSAETASQQGNQHTQRLPESSIPDIVSFAAPLVVHESLALSERVCQLVESLLRRMDLSSTRQDQDAALESALRVVLRAMDSCAAANGTLRLRYCTIFSRLLAHSDRVFNMCVSAGIVDAIVQLVRTPDPLLQMTALDLLVGFAGTASGMRYLLDSGVVQWLVGLAGGQEEQAEQDPYLGPDAVRCCAEILTHAAKWGMVGGGGTALAAPFPTPTQTQLLQGNAGTATPDMDVDVDVVEVDVAATEKQNRLLLGFLRAMLRNIDSQADGSRYASLDAISTFATSCEGALLLTLGNEQLVECWLSLLRSPKPELRGAVLLCLAHVIGRNTPAVALAAPAGAAAVAASDSEALPMDATVVGDSPAVSAAKQRLCLQIGQPRQLPTVKFLVNAARQPVSESKHGACRVLAAMARHSWGLHILFASETDGFWEYLKDYRSEQGQQQKEWKYEVVNAVATSPGIRHLRADVQTFMAKRLQQGPFFVPADVEDPQVL